MGALGTACDRDRSDTAASTSAPDNALFEGTEDDRSACLLSNVIGPETWDEGGRPTGYDHAERRVDELLAAYEPPTLDDAVRAELDDFVDRRIAEGGVETDF